MLYYMLLYITVNLLVMDSRMDRNRKFMLQEGGR
jgi:hypothetical protein